MGWFQDLLKEVPLNSVLRERLELAADRVQRSEEKVTELTLQLDEARKEIASLRSGLALREAQLERGRLVAIDGDTAKMLAHLVDAEGDDRDVGNMAFQLGWKQSIVQFHLDELKDIGYAVKTGGNYVSGHVYWAATPEGRKYAVKNGLLG